MPDGGQEEKSRLDEMEESLYCSSLNDIMRETFNFNEPSQNHTKEHIHDISITPTIHIHLCTKERKKKRKNTLESNGFPNCKWIGGH